MVSQGWVQGHIRATVFAGLVLGLFLLVLANRNLGHSLLANLRLRNVWLVRMLVAVMVMLALIVAVPWLRQVMGLTIPPIAALGFVIAILFAATVWMEALRLGGLQYFHE